MSEQQNVLSFTVNESLHMEAGQEIEEMLAISLEPDIALETFDEYMQIRGLIILQGECSKANVREDLTNRGASEIDETVVYMDKVIDTQVDQMMFSHRFPVEVSIARNRVENMADIKVEVVSFDYELPSNEQINIQATLHIHGIKSENLQKDGASNEKKEETIIEEEIKETEKEPETNIEPVGEQAVEESVEFASDNNSTETTEAMQDDYEPISSETLEQEDDQTIDIQLSETAEGEKEISQNDVLFLTDLFGDVEEASVTTMRIHIIQEEDTVESIAKRYDMSALQLMKDNNLHADDMVAGSLIYIANK